MLPQLEYSRVVRQWMEEEDEEESVAAAAADKSETGPFSREGEQREPLFGFIACRRRPDFSKSQKSL